MLDIGLEIHDAVGPSSVMFSVYSSQLGTSSIPYIPLKAMRSPKQKWSNGSGNSDTKPNTAPCFPATSPWSCPVKNNSMIRYPRKENGILRGWLNEGRVVQLQALRWGDCDENRCIRRIANVLIDNRSIDGWHFLSIERFPKNLLLLLFHTLVLLKYLHVHHYACIICRKSVNHLPKNLRGLNITAK